MPASTHTEPGLSKREEASVSSAAMSGAPWGTAVVAGAVVGAADLGLNVIGGNIGLHTLSGSVSIGVVALLVVAAAGAVLKSGGGRAVRWARENPWRFAIVPGVAALAIAFVLSVVLGGGVFGSIWAGVWHGAATYGLTGVAASVGGARNRRRRNS